MRLEYPEEVRFYSVLAGLVPAIHVVRCSKKDVDARHKAGRA
jgi:hypothetical protein